MIGVTDCPQIMSTAIIEGAPVPTVCGQVAEVTLVDGEYVSTCPDQHKHTLSESFVATFVSIT
jgi:hypothetical protein